MVTIINQVFCGEVELVETMQFETIEECILYWEHVNKEKDNE